MAATIGEINPNVPTTVQVPDTYLFISTTPTTVTTDQPRNQFLLATGLLTASALLGPPYNLSAGTAVANSIGQFSNVTNVNLAFGRRSPIAGRFRNAIQQTPIGVNFFLGAIQEPSNSGFAGVCTKLLTFIGTAQGSGQILVRLCGYDTLMPVANADTAAIMATDGKSEIDAQVLDAPMVTTSLIGSATIPLTYITRGEDGNDSPVLINIPSQITGVGVSPGTITVSTTSIGHSSGASLFVLQCDTTTYPVTVPVSTTPAQAAALITAEINTTTGPLAATVSGAVVTLYYRSGWYVKKIQMSSTEDATGQVYTLADRHDGGLPVVTATGNATGTSSVTITANGIAKVVPLTAAWTPTQSAAAIAAALAGDATFPLNGTSVGGVVSCTWRVTPGSVTVSTTDATQTFALTFPATITTVATVPGNPALTGLSGAGDPSLTALLANKAKLPAMIEWSCDYLDATSTSAIYAHVEQYANGYYQQNQRVTFVSTDPLATAALVATSATPNLGNSWRYSVGVYQGAGCSGGAYASAVAALLAGTDLPFNMDSTALAVGTFAPMLPGRAETDLDPTSLDVALGSYHLFPFVGVNGAVTIVRGKTCWTAENKEWGDWSYGRTFDLIRFQLRAFLNTRFRGKVLFYGGGVIRVANGVRLQDIKNAIAQYLDAVDGILIDGAKNLKQYIAVEPVPTTPGFIRIYFRAAVPRELHVLSGVIGSI
jgi:phage tail sheath gpL-like